MNGQLRIIEYDLSTWRRIWVSFDIEHPSHKLLKLVLLEVDTDLKRLGTFTQSLTSQCQSALEIATALIHFCTVANANNCSEVPNNLQRNCRTHILRDPQYH